MKYCVLKGTTMVIDGSDNPVEVMLLNVVNSGFAESDIEVLTEEEYSIRKENEPKPPQPPATEERLAALEMAMLAMLDL